MFGFLQRLVGNNSAREIKKMRTIVEQINGLEDQLIGLSDTSLAGKTREFKQRLENGETLDDILPEAFAVVREASKRVLGMRHFDVQLIGGITLHRGNIAEMRTGEGKTLVATLPVYLNALTGKGVHVVTVNDYLAKRDSEWMGKLYRFLGLSVGLIVAGLDYGQRKAAYGSDITYGTNNEFGFDYLRDNMVVHAEQMVQRPLNYAIVDEVDSILIDEARTPLIISGPGERSTDSYYTLAKIVPKLVKDEDYTIDEKQKTIAPTESGISKVEKMLKIENLYDSSNLELNHLLIASLRAYAMMHRDKDYVVKDGQVVIVDEFTGRLMFGRRYSDGLHQAIEAKEGLKVERESQTLASITFQNYFRMYEKLAGMTGTAKTEEQEFNNIYGLEVYEIPSNKPLARKDLPDLIFKTKAAKYRAAVKDVVARHAKGQPILVGTTSITQSEELSDMLTKAGVPHNVLNAKHHEKEAEIVANAGQRGMVTIATNMAGRGTDISLGEGVPELGGLHILGTERHESRRIDNQLRGRAGRQGDPGSSVFYVSLEDKLMRLFASERIAKVMDRLGFEDGERIESPMISKSIERAQRKVEENNFGIRKHLLEYDDVMNKQRTVIYSERQAVLKGEDIHKDILRFISDTVESYIKGANKGSEKPKDWDWEGLFKALNTVIPTKVDEDEVRKIVGGLKGAKAVEAVRDLIVEDARQQYGEMEETIGETGLRDLERRVVLAVLDRKWREHLYEMDYLKDGIGLRGMGQRDPLVEYQREGYQMYNSMIEAIKEETVQLLFHIDIKQVATTDEAVDEVEETAESADTIAVASGPDENGESVVEAAEGEVEEEDEDTDAKQAIAESAAASGAGESTLPVAGPAPISHAEGKVPVSKRPKSEELKTPWADGRTFPGTGKNAPCPCGSGRKYKMCHGQNEK